MATRLVYIPLSITASSNSAARAGRDLTRTQSDGLTTYNQLRVEGWAADSTSPVTLASGAFLAVIMHRPDTQPTTIAQEFSEAYGVLLNIERDLGMDIDDAEPMKHHIEAIYQKLQDVIRKLEVRQPIGDLNGTEED